MRALADRAAIRCQLPLAAGETSQPQPDFAVVPSGDYIDDHPDSAHLVVAISDSSLRYDRTTKAQLYAQRQFADYWIVNVAARRIEVHREPVLGKYRDVHELGDGLTITGGPRRGRVV